MIYSITIVPKSFRFKFRSSDEMIFELTLTDLLIHFNDAFDIF